MTNRNMRCLIPGSCSPSRGAIFGRSAKASRDTATGADGGLALLGRWWGDHARNGTGEGVGLSVKVTGGREGTADGRRWTRILKGTAFGMFQDIRVHRRPSAVPSGFPKNVTMTLPKVSLLSRRWCAATIFSAL